MAVMHDVVHSSDYFDDPKYSLLHTSSDWADSCLYFKLSKDW